MTADSSLLFEDSDNVIECKTMQLSQDSSAIAPFEDSDNVVESKTTQLFRVQVAIAYSRIL